MDEGLLRRVQQLEDERALARLVAEYCHGMDRRDLDRLLAIFHPDAVFDTTVAFGKFVGKKEIERGVTELMWPSNKASHHWTVNFVTEINGDAATGLSNFSLQGVDGDGMAVVVAGTYHDEFARSDGGWLITGRMIELHHFSPLPGVDWDAPSP